MRVIAGEARGVPLVAPAGAATRPTSDKLKGAIFSSLGELGCEGRVLDLFAGSGALGIEALSRGADWCDFVDSSEAACRAIRQNLTKTRLSEQAAVHRVTANRFVAAGTAATPYDLVLLDPPYAADEVETLLDLLLRSPLVVPRTAVVVEHAHRRLLPPALGGHAAAKTRAHGDSAYTLYLRRETSPP